MRTKVSRDSVGQSKHFGQVTVGNSRLCVFFKIKVMARPMFTLEYHDDGAIT